MKVINLNPAVYHSFVNGDEVECITDKLAGVSIGEHLMVYKNTVAATSDISVPTSSLQADAIGVEAVITGLGKLSNTPETKETERLRLKKI